MSHHEEQQNEIEALEAIYADDFHLLSKEPVTLEIVCLPHDDASSTVHVSARLEVVLPAVYPTVEPELVVRPHKGLSNDAISALTTVARDCAKSSVGDVCIYQVCEAIREWLTAHNSPQLTMFQQMEEREKTATASFLDEDDEDDKDNGTTSSPWDKQNYRSPLGIEPGTLVTVESFLAWKQLFDEEQKRIKEEQIAEVAVSEGEVRMSGKQLFLANLVKEIGDDEADKLTEEKIEAKKEAFWFQEDLYADIDLDEEIDDLGDDDTASNSTISKNTSTTPATASSSPISTSISARSSNANNTSAKSPSNSSSNNPSVSSPTSKASPKSASGPGSRAKK